MTFTINGASNASGGTSRLQLPTAVIARRSVSHERSTDELRRAAVAAPARRAYGHGVEFGV
jgi:hypothetical protein